MEESASNVYSRNGRKREERKFNGINNELIIGSKETRSYEYLIAINLYPTHSGVENLGSF